MAEKNGLSGFMNRPTMMIVGAVGFGLIAALLAGLYIQARGDAYLRSLAGGEVEEISVIVASSNLQEGTVVSEKYFGNTFAAQVAVDALVIDVELSGSVLLESVFVTCHSGQGYERPEQIFQTRSTIDPKSASNSRL